MVAWVERPWLRARAAGVRVIWHTEVPENNKQMLSHKTCSFFQSFVCVNPCTAPACKISGMKDARTRLQTVYFQSYNTSTVNAIITRFDENRLTCVCENEDKKA